MHYVVISIRDLCFTAPAEILVYLVKISLLSCIKARKLMLISAEVYTKVRPRGKRVLI